MSGSKGDVTYELRADDSKIESDLSQANKKVQNALKGIKDDTVEIEVNADTSGAKEELGALGDVTEELEDQFEDIGKKSEESASLLGNIGGVLKDSFTDAANSSVPLVGQVSQLTAGLTGAQVAAIGAGAAAAGIGVLAVNAADDMQGAMNSFLAETGKGKEELERYQGVLENIYGNNYGESFEDIASAMSNVTKTMGEMDDSSLQNVTESAFALRDTFEYDITESTRAAKAMMDNFGVSGEEAMSMIAAGAQNGLDYSGELLDSISEYSVQFDKMGLSADDMFQIFQKGAESGAFNLDKVGDAVKEMSIRVVDGSDTTKEGFKLLGLNADEMAKKFAAGGDTAREAFNQTLDALAAMEDPIEQNTAGVDLLGTMWEDLGPEAVEALAGIEDGAYDTADAMNQIKEVKYDDLNSMFEALKRNVELLVIPIGEALIPILSVLIESVLPVLTGLLGPLSDLFMALLLPIVNVIASGIQPLIQALDFLITNALQPLVSFISAILVPIFSGSLWGMFGTASGVIGNIINIFKSLMDFVKNVFTGNWRGAWNNIKDILSNAAGAWESIVKAPLNAIVSGWNRFANSLGEIKVPDWVPIAGGESIKLPTLPRLKVGMDYVPSDMYPAFLDKGEWVLTKEEANILRSLGGIEGILSMLDSRGGTMEVVVEGGGSFDYEAIGESVYTAFKRHGMGISLDRRVFGRIVEEALEERGY